MSFAIDEILASLQVVLNQVLPDDLDSSIAIASTLLPISVKPAGIGSFIAPSANPVGDIRGYYMEADAQIRVSTTDTLASLDAALARLMAAFSGLTRRRYVELGILRLGAVQIDPEIRQSGQGNNAILEQKVTFRIVYEFLKIPEETEGIIQTVPLNIELLNAPDA
ncbi:hypothetical protein IQ254_29945 [Nodosilinea sp. LEGE 07088]|uniref:hypothetical protein n=1 Tax=Nodosilinea sp. LEGE 07088 TaxID=2777968 RepID=UPI00187FC304|nr:hypothetical protein [Nodosilinea sp. LEGE 07088]MBE9141366.1 hypothetical protein [Nodosilinea sp. LEGE 07088]